MTSDDTTVRVSGLRNGVEYSFEVFAITASGRSVGAGPVTAVPVTGMENVVAGLIVEFENPDAVEEGDSTIPGGERLEGVSVTVAENVAKDAVLVELDEPVDLITAEALAEDLAADEAVAWAEPDQFFFTSSEDFAETVTVPTDSQYASSQWNLWDSFGISVGDGSSAMTDAWAGPRGDGVTVAVIDTGITAHPDLDSQLVPGFDFVSSPEQLASSRQANAPPVAFDGDYVDEATYGVLGRDANPTDPGDWRGVAPVRDSSWHGTKISGMIAAASNADGITGIAPAAKIQPIRALSWRGGLLSDIAASITWASGGVIDGVRANEYPSKVINMSFAVETMCPVALQQAIDGALERGSILVAAAGNASDDAAKYAPGNCNGVITVAATNRDGNRADYSNYGTTIDIAAPGGDSANPITTTSNSGTQVPDQPATASDSGTSIAAAHVSAAAAILLSRNTSITPSDAYTKLTGTDFVKAFNNEVCDSANPDYSCGAGILSLAQIASTCASTSQRIGNSVYVVFSADTNSTCISSWTPLTGVTNVNYLVVGGGGGGGVGRGGGGGGGGFLTGTMTVSSSVDVHVGQGGRGGDNTGGASTNAGVQGGSSKFHTAVAIGGGGGGGWSAGDGLAGGSGGSGGGASGSESTPLDGGTGSQGSNGGSNRSSRGACDTGWVLDTYCSGGGGGGASGVGGTGTVSKAGDGGAGNSVAWVTTVAGTLGLGNVFAGGGGGGGFYPSGATAGGSGGAGGGGNGCGGNGDCAGDAGVDKSGGGGGGGEGGNLGVSFGGRGGTGVVVLQYSAVPNPPTAVGAEAGQEQATVSWERPAFTGNTPIASYTVTSSPDGKTCSTSGVSCLVTGLTEGRNYTFTVTATNQSGFVSDISSASGSITPYGALAKFAVTDTSGNPLGTQTAGTPFTVMVTAQDLAGRTYTDFAGTVNITGTQSISTGGGVSPAFTAGVLSPHSIILRTAGTGQTITATQTGGAVTGTSAAFTVSASSTVQSLTRLSSGSQTAVMGSPVAVPMEVFAQDPFGNPVPSAPITFTVTAGGGTLGAAPGTSSATVNTDASGMATSPAWTLGTTVGALNNELEARNGVKVVTTLATATARPITITASSPSVTYPTAITQSFSVAPGSLAGSDAIGSLTYTYTGTGSTTYGPSTTAPTGGGTYSVVPSGAVFSTGSASNYDIEYVAGTVTIDRASQTITFGSLGDKTYGAAAFSISATATSSLTVTFTSTTSAVCSVVGTSVNILSAGTCTIRASQAGDANYSAATPVEQSFTVNPVAITVTADNDAFTYGGTATQAVRVTSGSLVGSDAISGATYTYAGTGGTSYVPSTTVPTDAGTYSITPSAAVFAVGSATNYTILYAAGSLTISKANQSIAFTSTVPPTPDPGSTYTPTASVLSTFTGAASGIAADFDVTPSVAGACTIESGVVTFVTRNETCVIEATAAGDGNFNAVTTAVTQTIVIGELNQTITFTQPSNVAFGSASFALSATATSGLDVSFTPSTQSACSVSALGVVTVLAVGTCTATAVQAGDGSYAPASSVTRVFQVVPALATAPTLTFASASNQAITVGFTAPGFTGGVAISNYLLTATPTSGSAVTSSACISSPCTISGLTNGVTYRVTVSAVNIAGTGPASSPTGALTPATSAFAVGALTPTPGNTVMDLTWIALTNDQLGGGSFIRYEVSFRETGDSAWILATRALTNQSTSSYQVTGLTNGTPYDFQVVAITSANDREIPGNTAQVVQYPSTKPSTPLNATVLALTATDVQFSWSAPLSDGGSVLTNPNYTVTVSGPSVSSSACDPGATGTTCTVSGLTNGSAYTFSVVANNREGASLPATVTYNAPSADASLSSLVVTGTGGIVTLSPAFASGTTAYTAQVTNSVSSVTVAPTTTAAGATVTVNGTAVTSGTSSGAIPLVVGSNDITVYVVASDPRSNQTYTIAVTRSAAPSPSGGGGAASSADRARVPVTPPAEVISGARPGAVLLDGQLDSSAAFAANGTNSGWSVVDNAFALSVRMESAGGSPVPMTPQGVMQVPQGGLVVLAGSKFLPGTDLSVFAIPIDPIAVAASWRMSDQIAPRASAGAVYLGEASVGPMGVVSGALTVPFSMSVGSYVLQINGVVIDDQVASVNMLLNVVPGGSLTRSAQLRDAAFYKAGTATFTSGGRAKLRSMVASIPASAQKVEIAVVGVSVSLDTPRANLRLARDRAENIVAFLKDAGVEGTVTVSLSTSFDLQSFQRSKSLSGAEQPMMSSSGKPLTTLTMDFTTTSP